MSVEKWRFLPRTCVLENMMIMIKIMVNMMMTKMMMTMMMMNIMTFWKMKTHLLNNLGKTGFINGKVFRVPGGHPGHDHDNRWWSRCNPGHDNRWSSVMIAIYRFDKDWSREVRPLVRLIHHRHFDVWALLCWDKNFIILGWNLKDLK